MNEVECDNGGVGERMYKCHGGPAYMFKEQLVGHMLCYVTMLHECDI